VTSRNRVWFISPFKIAAHANWASKCFGEQSLPAKSELGRVSAEGLGESRLRAPRQSAQTWSNQPRNGYVALLLSWVDG
jgi:hypothetical protein